jgi:hypothetical protein
MAKIKQGFGHFGIYGFGSPDETGRLCQWILYNIGLLREYLDHGGRWYLRRNPDGSSTFAAFDVAEVAGAQLGFVLNSEGILVDAWPPPAGACRLCGHPVWPSDKADVVHVCCIGVDPVCPACDQSRENQRTRWGWPNA